MVFKKHNPGCPCCTACWSEDITFPSSTLNVVGDPDPDCTKTGISSGAIVNGRRSWTWTADSIDWQLKFDGANYVIVDTEDPSLGIEWKLATPTHIWLGEYDYVSGSASGNPTVQEPTDRIDETEWEIVDGDWWPGVNWNFWQPGNGIYTTSANALLIWRASESVHWMRAQLRLYNPIDGGGSWTPSNGSEAIVIAGFTDSNNYLYTKAEWTSATPETWEFSLCKVALGVHSTLAGPIEYIPTGANPVTNIIATYDGTNFTGGAERQNAQSILMSTVVTGYGKRFGLGSGTLPTANDWVYVELVEFGNCITCCGERGTGPLRFSVTFADIANGTCSDAANFNTTFVMVLGTIDCLEYRNGSNNWLYNQVAAGGGFIGCDATGIATIGAVIDCGSSPKKITVSVGSTGELRYELEFSSTDLWSIASLDIPFVYSSGVLDGSASTCTISAL